MTPNKIHRRETTQLNQSKSMLLLRVGRFREHVNEKSRIHTSYYDSEKLSEINLELKKAINVLKQENSKLKSLLIKNKREYEMQGKEIENIMKMSVGKGKEGSKYEPHIIKNLKREIENMKDRYEQLENKNEELKRTLKATKINELEADLQVYASECERLRKIIEEGVSSMPDVSNEQQKICSELEAKLRGKLAENTTLTNTISGKNNEVKSLNEKLNQLKTQNDNLAKEAKQQESKLKHSAEKDIDSLKKAVNDLKDQINKMQQDAIGHKNEITGLNKKVKDYSTQHGQDEDHAKFLKEENEKCHAQIKQLKGTLDEQMRKIPTEDYTKKIQEYQTQNQKLMEELNSIKALNSQPKDNEIKTGISELRNQINKSITLIRKR